MLTADLVADLLFTCIKQALQAKSVREIKYLLQGALNILEGLGWHD